MTPESVIGSLISYLITADNVTRIAILSLMFLVTYFLLIWFVLENSKLTALAISFIPILVIDWIWSFGKFEFIIPFFTYTIDRFFLTLSLLSFVFDFQLFKIYGLEVYQSVSGTAVLNQFWQIIAFLFAVGDSILTFLILFYILWQIWRDVSYAVIGALLPTYLYFFIFNPFQEMAKSTETFQHLLYFSQKSTGEQQIIVLSTLVLSFIAVWLLLSVTINLFFKAGTILRPSMEAQQWSMNLSGVAFGLTVIYSFAQILHPTYTWYLLLPALIIAGVVKNTISHHSEAQKDKFDRQRDIEEVFQRIQ